jgi:hypothetical protein
MSLQKIMPLAEADALIDLSALVLEERPVVLTPAPARRTLPNRIAVVATIFRGIAESRRSQQI